MGQEKINLPQCFAEPAHIAHHSTIRFLGLFHCTRARRECIPFNRIINRAGGFIIQQLCAHQRNQDKNEKRAKSHREKAGLTSCQLVECFALSQVIEGLRLRQAGSLSGCDNTRLFESDENRQSRERRNEAAFPALSCDEAR
jgi:hypothetical protein